MPKKSITTRLESELIEGLDEESDEAGLSRSEYIRRILRERHENPAKLQQEVDTLRDRLHAREERIDTLERQLARRSNVEKKVDELAKRQESANAPFFVEWYQWLRQRE